MADLYIKGQFDHKEIVENIDDFRFDKDTLTLQQFKTVFENMNPEHFERLYYRNIMGAVNEPIPDDMIQVLLDGTDISLDQIVESAKLTDKMVLDIAVNRVGDLHMPIDFAIIHGTQLSEPKFKVLLSNIAGSGGWIDTDELSLLFQKPEYWKYVKYTVKNWETLGFDIEQLPHFQCHLFERTADNIISDADALKIFGRRRPTMSSIELRDYEPCRAGWKRTYKWAGRSDKSYSWNEFVAHHLVNNTQEFEQAQNDLNWLASVWSDENW